MIVREAGKQVQATHGVVCSFPDEFFGYFGWPSIARMEDGTLVVAASGLRNSHVCPFGRTTICTSKDDGASWTTPTVANDLPLDDRDAGVVALGDGRLLISWFSTDTRKSSVGREYRKNGDPVWVARYESGFARMTDENARRRLGAWVRISPDRGETWGKPIKVDLTAPHGPIRLRSGNLLYFGKEFLTDMAGFEDGQGGIAAMASSDGVVWDRLGSVPLPEGSEPGNYHEPHVVELADGRLLGMIRLENGHGTAPLEESGFVHFSLMQSESTDGGRTWTLAEPLGFHGSPPHLMLHSSGAVVCVYGYRKEPYGERAMISRDGGASWDYHYIIRDDGPGSDLGYPASVELADGSIFTIYYQKLRSVDEKCSILWSRWTLPG